MESYLKLRDRKFEVSAASVQRAEGCWIVEIETAPEEFDGERWAPRLYHQGLTLQARIASELANTRINLTDGHPGLGLMHVFGHHVIHDSTIEFGEMRQGKVETRWSGNCDVHWDKDFAEGVPFECHCMASIQI